MSVNQQVFRNGIEIQLFEVAASSSEVAVAYRLEGDGLSVKPAGYGLEMFGLNGEVVYPRSERRLKDGTRIASFPPLAAVPDELLFRSRFLLKEQFSPETHISLGSALSSADIGASNPVRVELGNEVAIGDDVVRVDRAVVGRGEMALYVSNPSGRILIGGLSGGASLVDNEGKSYGSIGRNIFFPEGVDGELQVGDSMIVFGGIENSSLDNLSLRSDWIAVLEEGPWEFRVKLD